MPRTVHSTVLPLRAVLQASYSTALSANAVITEKSEQIHAAMTHWKLAGWHLLPQQLSPIVTMMEMCIRITPALPVTQELQASLLIPTLPARIPLISAHFLPLAQAIVNTASTLMTAHGTRTFSSVAIQRIFTPTPIPLG